MEEPSQHATLFTFLHYAVHYIPSANTGNDQGVKYTPPTSMAHTFSSLVSYFKWKTHMTTSSATALWSNHIKSPLSKLGLNLHGLQIWTHLPAVHKQLLLLITFNPHILFHQMSIPYAMDLLSLSIHTFNLCLVLQPSIQPRNLVMKPYTRTLCNPFP